MNSLVIGGESEGDFDRLIWRCRRGSLELDLMLHHYLNHRYRRANCNERQAFLRLLDLEDGELIGYLLGGSPIRQTDLADVVAAIKRLPETL